MFAGLLNKGFRGSLAILIIFFLVTAVVNFLSTVDLEKEYYPNLFYNFFTRTITSKLLINLVNFLFIGMGVVLVAVIAANQEIVDKQNYFPVFLFLLLSAVSASPSQINSQIFTNVMVLYALYKLLDIYRREAALRQIFEAAFWLSVSAFFTISSLISFPLFFIVLLILRPFYWREWVVAIFGFFVPIFIYECVAYLTNFNQWYLVDATGLYLSSLRVPSFSEYFVPLSLSLFILLVLSIFYNIVNGFGSTVKKQRTKAILLWFVFFAMLGFFSGGANSSSIILTYAFPLSFLIGDFLFNLRQVKMSNTILTVIMLCTLIVFLGRLGYL